MLRPDFAFATKALLPETDIPDGAVTAALFIECIAAVSYAGWE
jgi:hypothetical protein